MLSVSTSKGGKGKRDRGRGGKEGEREKERGGAEKETPWHFGLKGIALPSQSPPGRHAHSFKVMFSSNT